MLDRPLDSWDFDFVVELVEKFEFEPGIFDFKDAMVGTGDQAYKDRLNASVAKAACGMANALGGFLIFGVKDRKHSDGLTAAARCTGIPKRGDLRKELSDRFGRIEPDIHFETTNCIGIPEEDDRCLFAAHIPRSPRRPHMADFVFYVRGAGGTSEPMTVYQVRDQVLETSGRFSRAASLLHEIALWRSLSGRMGNWRNVKLRFDASSLRQLLFQCHDLIPASQFHLYVDLGKLGNAGTMANGAIEELQKVGLTEDEVRTKVSIAKSQVGLVRKLAFDCWQRLETLLEPDLRSQPDGHRALLEAVQALGLRPFTSDDFFKKSNSGGFLATEEDLR